MSNYDRRVFDRGFAHTYPRDRGLTEGISSDFGRIISEPLSGDNRLYERLAANHFPLFPTVVLSHERIHSIPTDSRDLNSMIRLGREPEKISILGLILGIRLKQIHEITNELPADTILPRFAVHTVAVGSIATSGVDIKPLPPFDRYSSRMNLDDAQDLILHDLLDMGEGVLPKEEAFMEGIENGINMVA